MSIHRLPYRGGRSLEQIILTADVIARVDLVGKLTRAEQVGFATDPQGWGVDYWSPVMEFRFRVLEYLKGSGPNEIGGIVYRTEHDGGFWDTRESALAGAANMVAAHDSRWDQREAVVFLWSDDYIDDRIQLATGQYWFGQMAYYTSGEYTDAYSVSSIIRKAWLPEAAQPAGAGDNARASTNGKVFLLDAPSPSTRAGRAADSLMAPFRTARAPASESDAPTISLSALKRKIATLETIANAGGTAEYRECIERSYALEHFLRNAVASQGSTPLVKLRQTIGSGLSPGTPVLDLPGSGVPPDKVGIGWFEGPDKDLLRFVNVDFTPVNPELDILRFTRRAVTTRPLPAGNYTVYPNWTWHGGMVCARYPEISRQYYALYLTVTARERTLHEAFFDPVVVGTAVGAGGANGVLKPSAFSLDGATTTISSLKWQDGEVTMALSPTSTSLTDYAIDFIDTTGTTTLSLTSDNASTTALTWTIPDKPWADGDLLMLRIHKPISNDASLSNLALSGVDLAFDPATTTYAASVPATTTQTTVTLTLNHDSATYVVKLGGVVDDDGTISLAVGDNVITVDVTAEDAVTIQTYSVTITRATPAAPVTVTLTPRVEGLTFFDLTVQWNDTQACDNRYFVTVRRNDGYIVRNMGFHPAETSSVTQVTYWPMDNVPDFVAVVECDPSSGPRREVGRMSLRSARN